MDKEFCIKLGKNYWSASEELHSRLSLVKTERTLTLVEELYGFKVVYLDEGIYLKFSDSTNLALFVLKWGAT